jgi:hypothetical protein
VEEGGPRGEADFSATTWPSPKGIQLRPPFQVRQVELGIHPVGHISCQSQEEKGWEHELTQPLLVPGTLNSRFISGWPQESSGRKGSF